MAPGFYIQHPDIMLTQTGPTSASYYYSATTITISLPIDISVITSYADSRYEDGDYVPKKQETVKEMKIRQAAAFKIFYSNPGYVVRKSRKTERAEMKEKDLRINKFKSLNNNLLV